MCCLQGLFPAGLLRKWKTHLCVKCQVPKSWGPKTEQSAAAERRCAGVHLQVPFHLPTQLRTLPAGAGHLGRAGPGETPFLWPDSWGLGKAAVIGGFCCCPEAPHHLKRARSTMQRHAEFAGAPDAFRGAFLLSKSSVTSQGMLRLSFSPSGQKGRKDLCKKTRDQWRKRIRVRPQHSQAS